MSKTLWAGSMKSSFSPAAAPSAGAASAPQRQEVDQEAMSRTMNSLAGIQSMFSSPAMSSAAALTVSEAEFDQQAEQLLVAANITPAEADAEIDADELTQLLQQLRREPDNDEERAAKFVLYEKYADTVSDARKATLEFWQEALLEFEGGARAKVEHDIKKLDGHQNLGFDFAQAAQRWFVYDMVQQAHRNADTIEQLLSGIRTKLELLGSQAECPICFEPFQEDDAVTGAGDTGRPAATLSCCHKVCKECWAHWQGINPHNAFCPLCRQQDFLVRIMSDAEGS